jgi:TM2 domain-containing membrane protein YozV/DNA-directed RNA polymerase subunit RPC12/RpoP
MIVYQCYQCKAQLQSPDSMAGSYITCPSCKSTLVVPGAPMRTAEPARTTDAPAVAMSSQPSQASQPAQPATNASTMPITPPPVPLDAASSVTPAAAFASPASVASGTGSIGSTGSSPPSPPPTYHSATPVGVPPVGKQARVSRLIYVFLAVLLGGFGVHNFAAGYTNTAVLQLVTTLAGFALAFCTLGISFLAPIGMYVWAIVEAITVTRDADGVTMPQGG